MAGRAAAGFLQFTKMQREAELLLVRQGLIAKHQHGVFSHSRVDRRNLIRRQRIPAIDARYFAGESRGKLSDRYGQTALPI
jgi:hypothetical protein